MKTGEVTPADLSASVIAVPPAARHPDLSPNYREDARLISHIESGGIKTLLYGGNANYYNLPISEFSGALSFLADTAGDETWVIPSIGPDYGKAIDQAEIMRTTAFPCAMLLPPAFAFSPSGISIAVRRITDVLRRPLIMYIKAENYVGTRDLQELVKEGRVCAVKYGIARPNPSTDEYLASLSTAIGSDRIVSGIGEQPALAHLQRFGVASFTSGLACIAPRLSQRMLELLKSKNVAAAEDIRSIFAPLEHLRDRLGAIRALHAAVSSAEIASMGPILPMLHDVDASEFSEIQAAVRTLLARTTAMQRHNASAPTTD